MESQQINPMSSILPILESSQSMSLPQPTILKQDTAQVNQTDTPNAPSALQSFLSVPSAFVPPGVSTLSSLNSLALAFALRLTPVNIAHTAPAAFHTAAVSSSSARNEMEGRIPFARFQVSADVLTLDPEQQFPLSMPLQIPWKTHFPHHLHPHMPSQAQLIEDEDEDEEAQVKGKWWHSTLSGVIGGICCVYAGQPFDTIKVRLQTQNNINKLYNSPLDCFRKTISQGGYRALYKGSSAALASVVLENSVLFTANSYCKKLIKSLSKKPSEELSLAQEALAGGLAGFFSSTAITPAEVIKCRLQIQDRTGSQGVVNTPLKYKGPLDACRQIFKQEGFKGLFSGLPSVWMRDIPFNFVFLGSYEAYCSLAAWKEGRERNELGAAEMFVAGGLAVVTGWSIIFPMDVVKSKMQTAGLAKASTYQVIKNTLKTEGIRAFYQGWSAAVMRAFPANAALLLGVETSKRFFESFD
jgi:hypothetical protein